MDDHRRGRFHPSSISRENIAGTLGLLIKGGCVPCSVLQAYQVHIYVTFMVYTMEVRQRTIWKSIPYDVAFGAIQLGHGACKTGIPMATSISSCCLGSYK